MKAAEIIDKYIKFFVKNGHKQIANSPLVPENDPTTLFTSSGMQPLVPYLLGEVHPQGKGLVDVQNSFRAVDIDEIGDNRHTTFFRMLGNWSLGDYYKKEQIPWIFTFLTKELNLTIKNLYVTVFDGYKDVQKDDEAVKIWENLFNEAGLNPKDKIYYYGIDKNWWSRSGPPDKMPAGEPGGPSSEIFYDFGASLKIHEHSQFSKEKCHPNCDCGRFVEIGNNVFMAYKKQNDGSLLPLPKPNVDFGGGLERLLIASEDQPDVFKSSLLAPVIETIEDQTHKNYQENELSMRILTDHLTASSFIVEAGITPSNKDQGYVLRRLIRRGYDHFSKLGGKDLSPVIESIVGAVDQETELWFEKIEERLPSQPQNPPNTN